MKKEGTLVCGYHNLAVALTKGSVLYSFVYSPKNHRTYLQKAEKAVYHKNVHVYWQSNAWMDRAVAGEWVRNTFAPNVDKTVENVLFLDNLNCQVTGDFHNVCKELASTLVYALPAEEKDKCQPVDQGDGYLIKKLMGQQLDKYLEQSDNLLKWQSSLTAGERRILITHWLVDGSEDHLIKPDGFDNYSF
eukprot:gene1546-1709_t